MSNLMEMESGKVFDSHKETLGSMLREGARLISVAQRKSTDERKRSSFFTNLFNREWEFAALKNLTAFGGKHNLFKTVWSYVCLCFDSGKTCGVSYFLPFSRLATILLLKFLTCSLFWPFLDTYVTMNKACLDWFPGPRFFSSETFSTVFWFKHGLY